MGSVMNDNTTKVLERLVYEKVLIHNQLSGRRWRITIENLIQAGDEEPRILEVLPALLAYRPQIIAGVKNDLKKHPILQQLAVQLTAADAPKSWKNIPLAIFQKQARNLRQLWQHQKTKTKWRNINIRVSQENIEQLDRLAQRSGPRNKSTIIRELIARAAAQI
jgi:hypothetical protein